MADVGVKIMKSWIDEIRLDPNLDATEQEIAYIIYAAVHYGHTQEKINIGEVFGKEFKALNMAMPNIYVQIDKIKNYDPSDGKNIKYDAEAIKECRLKGMSAKEICRTLGYPEDKAKSLTSNKGWIEANKIRDAKKEQNDTENTDSVQKERNITSIKNTDSVQKNTEMTQTEKTDSVQKYLNGFNF